jgi:hypothetical protein
MSPCPTSWRSILMLSSHVRLGLQVLSFSQFFQNHEYASHRPIRATYPSHLIIIDLITRTMLGK